MTQTITQEPHRLLSFMAFRNWAFSQDLAESHLTCFLKKFSMSRVNNRTKFQWECFSFWVRKRLLHQWWQWKLDQIADVWSVFSWHRKLDEIDDIWQFSLEQLHQCLVCGPTKENWMKKVKTCQFGSTKWFWHNRHNIFPQDAEAGKTHSKACYWLAR